MADHDEHQVGQPPQGLVLPEGLHQGGDVLLGVGPAHGQDGGLVGVPQEFADFLQPHGQESCRPECLGMHADDTSSLLWGQSACLEACAAARQRDSLSHQ